MLLVVHIILAYRLKFFNSYAIIKCGSLFFFSHYLFLKIFFGGVPVFNFKAYFYGNDVYINEKYRYSSNEILIAYLNDRRVKYILDSDFVYELK